MDALHPIEGFALSPIDALKIECEACGFSHVQYGAHLDLGLRAWAQEHYERCASLRALLLERADALAERERIARGPVLGSEGARRPEPG